MQWRVRLTFGLGLVALVAALLPTPGMFVAMGAGFLAVFAGWRLYRTRAAAAGLRLIGAATVTLGCIALLLAWAKYAATLVAVRVLLRMLQAA